MDSRYTDEQLRSVARLIAERNEKLWASFLEEAGDDLLRYLHVLLFKIYEMHLNGRHMTKGQASRYIPARHSKTCKKYLDLAVSENLIEIVPHSIDKRKQIIKPRERLLTFARSELAKAADEIKDAVSELA